MSATFAWSPVSLAVHALDPQAAAPEGGTLHLSQAGWRYTARSGAPPTHGTGPPDVPANARGAILLTFDADVDAAAVGQILRYQNRTTSFVLER